MKRLARTAILAVMVAGMALAATPAEAAGSDDPTPYTVTAQGITLPAGAVFHDGDHVNLETTDGRRWSAHLEAKCITRTDAECAGTRHDHAQYIGASYMPLAALGLTGEYCVKWVQLAAHPEHYGEGGQPPVCTTVPPTDEPTDQPTTPEPEPSWTAPPTPEPSSSPEPESSPSPTSAPPSSSPSPSPASPSEPSSEPSPEPGEGSPSTRPASTPSRTSSSPSPVDRTPSTAPSAPSSRTSRTLTPPSASSDTAPELAATGPSRSTAMLAVGVVLAGTALLAASRRRGRR